MRRLPFVGLAAAMLSCSASDVPSDAAPAGPTDAASDAALDARFDAAPSSEFVTSRGTEFFYQGRAIRFSGSTFYPSTVGGSSAWHKSTFTSYIDQMLDLQAQGGMNILRPTDYWDKNTPGQSMTEPVLWANMDHLLSASKTRGHFVQMDISAYKWLLTADGKDPYDATNWYAFIDWVGARYKQETVIAYWYLSGEPPVPTNATECGAMVSFYRSISDRMRAVDANHLIASGGFNHMNDERACDWWHQIYRLSNNDVLGYKTYSQNDLDLTSTITAFGRSLGKPMFNAEFGEPQQVGDCTWSGTPYNGIQTSRAQFFQNAYDLGQQGGVAGFLFWNLGPQVAATSYQVNPKDFPCTWQVIKSHAPQS
jgi:hypothetical protein